MTKQSHESMMPSPTDGRAASSLRTANARLIRKRAALAATEPRPAGESMPNLIATCRASDVDGRLAKACLPERHMRGVSIDRGPDGEKWRAKVETLCDMIGSGFLVALIGNRGTGKTQAAVVAAIRAVQLERTALYCKAMEIFLDIRGTYKREDRTELDALDKYLAPQLLIIDEIQQRGETAFEDRMLAYLIDKRYDAMVDTLLLGNLTPEALKDSLDPSIVDRIRETGGRMEFTWKSFRG